MRNWKMNFNLKYPYNKNFYYMLIFIIVMLVITWPLFEGDLVLGHDLKYHLLRIESLKNNILTGQPFSKISSLFFNNAGYASSLFYPDALIYLPAILRSLGLNITLSYNIFLIFCISLCYITTFYITKLITKSSYCAIISSIIYTLCQYHIDDIYIRSAAGEIAAFIFIPLLVFGIYDLIYDDFKKPWIMAVGFIGIMLCHTITLIISLFIYSIIVTIHIKVLIKNKNKILKLLLTAIIVLLITIFYWLPVCEQMMSNRFLYSIPWTSVSMMAVDFPVLFGTWLSGMGFIIYILCYPRIFLHKTKCNLKMMTFADECLLFGILLSLSATKLFPWKAIEQYANFIQFPWRLYIYASLFLSISIAIYFELYSKSERDKKYGLIFIICTMTISAFISYMSFNMNYTNLFSESYFSKAEDTCSVGAGEWLPIAASNKDSILKNSNVVFSDTGQKVPFQRIKNTIIVYGPFEGMRYIDVPFIFYKGYSAYFYLNNKPYKLDINGEGNNGFSRIRLPLDCNGVIKVKYEGTLIQHISSIISIVTIISLLIFIKLKDNYLNFITKRLK